jgi:Calcineurin-like phosphoesterase
MSASKRLLGLGNPAAEATFQIMSDLHLEVGQQYSTFRIPSRAPYLILAGDVGRLRDYEAFRAFLRDQVQQFMRVFLVLGNHEFYGESREEGLKLAASMEIEPELQGKLTIMDRAVFEISPDLVILGCTLHSHVPPESVQVVQQKISDFKRIEGWSVEDHNLEHDRDITWLRTRLDEYRSQENSSSGNGTGRRKPGIVVVTHYAPSKVGTSAPQHEDNAWSSAFATPILERDAANGGLNASSLQCWIFGHTHYNVDTMRSGMRLISNQRGYVFPGASQDTSALVRTSNFRFLQHVRKLFPAKTISHPQFDVEKVISI